MIDSGVPYLARDEDWAKHPDLAFYSVVAKSNMKFPISLNGAPAVLNVWSAQASAYDERTVDTFADVAAEISRSPFQLELEPVGLSLRKVRAVLENRQARAA